MFIILRWAGLGTRIGGGRDAHSIWWGNLKEKDNLETSGLGGGIILKWIFKKFGGSLGLYLRGSG